jgi:predicted RNA-binding protein with PIN domain
MAHTGSSTSRLSFARAEAAMHTLIDGYNLMFADGLPAQRPGPDAFRKVRQRFLDRLARGLGPFEASQTTVVFDAADHPADLPAVTMYKGMTIVFAVDDEDADARIERLIAQHSAPKTLRVVSTDRRIRTATARRKAQAMTADEFLGFLDDRKRIRPTPPAPPMSKGPRDRPLSPQESAYWLKEFGALDDGPEVRDLSRNDAFGPSDAEIAEVEREVEGEAW